MRTYDVKTTYQALGILYVTVSLFILNTEGKEDMAKKIVSAIERVLSKQVEPITEKWYTDKATDTLDHQPAQGTIDNDNEVEINERSNTPGRLDTLKIQDTKITSDTQ